MRCLYHLWLSPFCRKVRLVLGEKGLDFDMKVEKTWERRPEFLAMNPAGQVPVLVENEDIVLVDSGAICEYLEEIHPDSDKPLLGRDPVERAEVRRLLAWFDIKFYREVTNNLVGEKIQKRFLGLGHPDSSAIRAGHANIHTHLDYIVWLTERRSWLAGSSPARSLRRLRRSASDSWMRPASASIGSSKSRVGAVHQIGPSNPSATSLGSRPLWSIWACVRVTAAMRRGSKANGPVLSDSSEREPWNSPQSTSIDRPPWANSMHEPVTV